jgi:hypothetical protein
MPVRYVEIEGARWGVQPSGHVTQYDADEFGVVFVRTGSTGRELRLSRFRPGATRSREQAFAELSDAALRELFARSQPGETSPEGGYTR